MVYHLYNRGNNRERIFREERNYAYFLTLYDHHISPIAETYAYCLLPNHFHFSVRIRDDAPDGQRISRCFANLFNAYARSFNRSYRRSGVLFERSFERKAVTDDRYLRQLIIYIHRNPQHHGLIDDFRTWTYSSYQTLIGTQPTRLKRDTVLASFGGLSEFIAAHKDDFEDL
ncbi:MAG: transposase [Chloroflexia bacterium]|nr:transposase [Chloroflexia bacterium]